MVLDGPQVYLLRVVNGKHENQRRLLARVERLHVEDKVYSRNMVLKFSLDPQTGVVVPPITVFNGGRRTRKAKKSRKGRKHRKHTYRRRR